MDINQIASIAMPIILGGAVYLVKKLIVPIGDTVIDYLLEKKSTLGINKQLAEHQNEITTAKESRKVHGYYCTKIWWDIGFNGRKTPTGCC
jgi:hypothetical protein